MAFKLRTWRRVWGWIPALYLAVCLAGGALAADAGLDRAASDLTAVKLAPPANVDEFLARDRWSEQTYGLSLRPPLDCRLQRETADQAILRILGPGGWQMVLTVKTYTAPMDLNQLVRQSVTNVAESRWESRLLQRVSDKVLGVDAAVLYYLIPITKKEDRIKEDMVMGEAIIPLNPKMCVLLRLDATAAHFNRLRPIFEGVLDSMKQRNIEEMDQERRQIIERGETWRRRLTTDMMARVLLPEQWFLITDKTRKIGFMYIQQGRATQAGLAGIQVTVGTRMEIDGALVESSSRFFLSEMLDEETWAVRTSKLTSESKGHLGAAKTTAPVKPITLAWTDSGVRSGNQVKVTRNNPDRSQQLNWDTPPTGYLPLTQVYLLGQLLPAQAAADYGFYAYYPNQGKLTLRVDRIEPLGDGGFLLRSVPALDMPAQVSRYDAHRRLVERDLGDGRRMTVSSREEIQKIFGTTKLSQ